MYTIDPTWRTDTVTQLCTAIRAEDDYSSMPILADALQDAGCDNNELLEELRSPTTVGVRARTLVGTIMLPDIGAAVKWIEDLAARLGPNYGYDADYDGNTNIEPGSIKDEMNYAVLMYAARAYIDCDDIMVQHGSESWRNLMGPTEYREFWKNYAIITGEGYGRDRHDQFIGCSC